MTVNAIELQLRLVGALLLGVAALGVAVHRHFRWGNEIQRLTLLTRQVFLVHSAFVTVVLAMLGAMTGTMLPSTLLSGLIFPIASLPDWIRAVTNIVPARWFIVIARGIMLKGIGVSFLWRELAVLALMLGVLLILAIRGFKARLA